MYSLDINFLSDRTQRPTDSGIRGISRVQESPRPMYVGAIVGIALPALVLGAWILLQNRNTNLEKRQAELDSQLTALQAQLSEVNSINNQVSQIESENQALATVFDRIKPWSAILQDLRERVPNNVQVSRIEQFTPEATPSAPSPSPSPAASPSPGASPGASPQAQAPAGPASPSPSVRITGVARSFNDVNDFLLTLQQSPFLNSDNLKIVSSQLIENPTKVEVQGQSGVEVELPRVVQYTIEGALTNLTASELLKDLERTLSVGLAARIQALRDRGVLKQ